MRPLQLRNILSFLWKNNITFSSGFEERNPQWINLTNGVF